MPLIINWLEYRWRLRFERAFALLDAWAAADVPPRAVDAK